MPERRVDGETRSRVDELNANLNARIDKLDEKLTARADANAASSHHATVWMKRALVVFGVGLSIVVGISRYENSRRVDEIQDSRRESAALACMETNARHDNALIEFDKLLLRAVNVTPRRYPQSLPSAVRLDRYDRDLQAAFKLARVREHPRFAQIKASASTTPLLINALVPRRDCVAYVRRLIK